MCERVTKISRLDTERVVFVQIAGVVEKQHTLANAPPAPHVTAEHACANCQKKQGSNTIDREYSWLESWGCSWTYVFGMFARSSM